MQLTMRLNNDNYLDFHINFELRELTLLSPIPNITMEELMQVADDMHYKINLLITEEQIIPDDLKIPDKEIDKYYSYDTKTALSLILGFCNTIISEH